MLTWITLGFTILTLITALCLITSLRRWSRHCTKRFDLGPKSFTAPRRWTHESPCSCHYVADDYSFARKSPPFQPHWETGKSCEQFYLKNGHWPEYCNGPG